MGLARKAVVVVGGWWVEVRTGKGRGDDAREIGRSLPEKKLMICFVFIMLLGFDL